MLCCSAFNLLCGYKATTEQRTLGLPQINLVFSNFKLKTACPEIVR